MKTTISIYLIFLASLSCFAQQGFRYGFDLNFDYGNTNDLSDETFYSSTNIPDQLTVEKRTAIRVRYFSFGFTRNFNRQNGLRFSVALPTQGFSIRGFEKSTGERIEETLKRKVLQLGISYIRSIHISDSERIIIQPGISWNVFRNQEPSPILLTRKNGYSFNLHAGYEVPLSGENIFANLGVVVNWPLSSLNGQRNGEPGFYPYFIGLRLGFSVQFETFLE